METFSAVGNLLNPRFGAIFLPVFLTASAVWGQVTLSGFITDETGRPIEGVSITVYKRTGGPVLAFAISSDKGAYSITLASGADTFRLAAAHISYARQEKTIARPLPQRLDWAMQAQAMQLPEMVVRQPGVVRRGDTLAFDVNRLKKGEDRTLEQVLARIPGITVEANGRILYQDLPISKFYIEGLDMLEGRYALATRNLNLEAVRDIEILERHQPVRALDSLITPPNGAINLRLKSKTAFVGEAETGGGFSPALYAAKGNLFGFQKEQQLNFSGAINNIGEAQGSSFRGLYDEISFSEALVGATVIPVPFSVKGYNALDNRERTGGFNLIRKTGAYGQLKLQAYATGDRLQYQGTRARILRDADQEVRFDERLNAKEMLRLGNGRLLYELNQPRLYTKASVETEKGGTTTHADNKINGNNSAEEMDQEKWVARGRLETVLRKGNKAWRLWAKAEYQDEEASLILRPLDVLEGAATAVRLDQAIQTVHRRRWDSDIYTGFILRRKQLVGHFKSGLRLQRQYLDSDLAELSFSGSRVSQGSPFINDMNQTLWASYVEQNYIWQRRTGEWKLNLPVAFHRLTLQDHLAEDRLQRMPMVFRPHIEYLPRKGGFSAQLIYKQDYNEDQLFYNSLILRMNRQFDRQVFALNQRNAFELNLSDQGRNIRSGLYYRSGLNLSLARSDWLTTTVFDSLGQVSAPASASNWRRRAGWQNRFEATPLSSLQIKLETHYSLSLSPGFLNDRRVNIRMSRAWVESYLAYTFRKSVISCRPRADFYTNSLSATSTRQMQWRWVFFQQFPKQWGNLHIGFNQYRTTSGSRRVNNQLLNIRYENQIPSSKLNIGIYLNNLSDEGHFITFSQESFYEELSAFQLRPRQFILKLSAKF